MPQLDSFNVDHTRMHAPAVRIAKTMQTPKGDDITVYDLRFCVPNEEILSEKGIHTLEHLFAGFMRDHLDGNGVEIIDGLPHWLLYELNRHAKRAKCCRGLARCDARCVERARSKTDSRIE